MKHTSNRKFGYCFRVNAGHVLRVHDPMQAAVVHDVVKSGQAFVQMVPLRFQFLQSIVLDAVLDQDRDNGVFEAEDALLVLAIVLAVVQHEPRCASCALAGP